MLTFRTLLELTGLPIVSVRLLRHQDNRYPGFPTPYVFWRDHRARFDAYQETQAFGDTADLKQTYWVSFVGLPATETLFVGIYSSALSGPLPTDRIHPVTGNTQAAGSCDLYRLTLLPSRQEYSGRLGIKWGRSNRQWIQRADGSPKPILELRREFAKNAFPGFMELVLNLSQIETIAASWMAALSATRGIHLLTCRQKCDKTFDRIAHDRQKRPEE
jgi:hypothetical protein